MNTQFEAPEIKVTTFSAENVVGNSNNELPLFPFSNRNENDLDIFKF